jgi:hypothetical protein
MMAPTDEDFDDMHHAIGRKGIEKAFRNYYCTETDGPTAKRFEALGFWDKMRTINDGRDAIYSVNLAGIDALRAWLSSHPSTQQGTDNA